MRVRVISSFATSGQSFSDGEIIDLPNNVDWLKCGLVELAKGDVKPNKTRKTKEDNDNENPNKV